VGSDTSPEQGLFYQTINFLRPQLISVPGVQIPYPYGGKQAQVVVDLDPDKLFAYGISPGDVSTALNSQNLILPAGTAKIGKQEYQIILNSSPATADQLNDLPIKTVNGVPIYMKDVAHVRDGFIVQTSIVHADGGRGLLLSILKAGSASTLNVVNGVMGALPQAIQSVQDPKHFKLTPMFDQSIFVRASVWGVVKRSGHCRGFDRADDPAVPGFVAIDGDRDDFDSAVDPGVDHHPVGAGRDAECDDPGRDGAGGGNSCG